MGLFDGTGSNGETGSTAELAGIIGWPVVLVVDARGQGASVAALLRGFAGHQLQTPIAGVIFNRVSSARHAALLAGAVAAHLPNLCCVGALRSDPALVLPGRHLGLIPAGEIGAVDTIIDLCATQIGAALDIDRLLELACRSRIPKDAAAAAPISPLGQRMAIARDQAFCFAYPALLEGWRHQGAELEFFSPLATEPPHIRNFGRTASVPRRPFWAGSAVPPRMESRSTASATAIWSSVAPWWTARGVGARWPGCSHSSRALPNGVSISAIARLACLARPRWEPPARAFAATNFITLLGLPGHGGSPVCSQGRRREGSPCRRVAMRVRVGLLYPLDRSRTHALSRRPVSRSKR